jgi:hypothetical protein
MLVIFAKKHGLEYDAREQPMYCQILEIAAGCNLTYFTARCILAASIFFLSWVDDFWSEPKIATHTGLLLELVFWAVFRPRSSFWV